MRVAFYAPLKGVDHPVPSGDRTMARALVKALGRAGHDVMQVSGLRSFLAAPDVKAQERIAREAGAEVERIAGLWDGHMPPDAWITYHNHYKAPDLLGPALSQRFGLPFLMAEASHAQRRAAAWGSWYAAAVAAIQAADTHICFTARDRRGLEPLLGPGTPILDLPPFIDMDGVEADPAAPPRGGPLRLVTVAMMRSGDKRASYALLADALTRLHDEFWHLSVVGDGPARGEVEQLFAELLPGRVTWHGALDQAEARHQVRGSDLFVWPGLGEAFGMAYLEAQAVGVPVLALDVAGVPAVVEHRRTGILVKEPTAKAFAEALCGLMSDRMSLARMGAEAQIFIRDGRTLDQASERLDDALRRCVEGKGRHHG